MRYGGDATAAGGADRTAVLGLPVPEQARRVPAAFRRSPLAARCLGRRQIVHVLASCGPRHAPRVRRVCTPPKPCDTRARVPARSASSPGVVDEDLHPSRSEHRLRTNYSRYFTGEPTRHLGSSDCPPHTALRTLPPARCPMQTAPRALPLAHCPSRTALAHFPRLGVPCARSCMRPSAALAQSTHPGGVGSGSAGVGAHRLPLSEGRAD